MANELIKKRLRLWIQDENGNRVSTVYWNYHVLRQKGDMVIICKYNNSSSIMLNLKTGKAVKEVDYLPIPVFYANSCRVFENLYTMQGELLLEKQNVVQNKMMCSHEYLVTKDQLTGKYGLIKDEKVEVSQCDTIEMVKEFILIIKDGMGTVIDGNSGEYVVENVWLSQAREYEFEEENNFVKIVYDCPVDREDEDLSKLIEVRDIFSLALVFSITVRKNQKWKVDFIEGSGYLLSVELEAQHYIYDMREKRIIIEKELLNKERLNDQYVVLHFLDYCCVYDKINGIVLGGEDYTNIRLSRHHSYFILESGELKGVANLDGKILLEPCTPFLVEKKNSIVYLKTEVTSLEIE